MQQDEYSVMQNYRQADNAAYSGQAPAVSLYGGMPGVALPLPGNPSVPPNAIYLLNGQNTQEPAEMESTIAVPQQPDQSALWMVNDATAHLSTPHIVKKGDTTDLAASWQSGLNAAIRVASGSFLSMRGGHISTMGIGASALFGTGGKTLLLLRETTLRTWMDRSPGLVVTAMAQARSSRAGIGTQGADSPAVLVTGQGSRLQAYETVLLTEGAQSPAVLCNAGLNLDTARVQADMSPALVLEAEGGATLSQVTLSGTNPATVLLRSREPNGADGPPLRLSMVRCVMPVVQDNPLFYITNVQADVVLSGMSVGQVGKCLLQVSGYMWGTAGYNGGNLFLRADNSRLNGDMNVDHISRADVILGQGTVWKGRFRGSGNTALSLERGSVWQPGGTCQVGGIDFGGREPQEGVSSIQQERGADVIYDPRVNPGLKGLSYSLPNGGRLLPGTE